MTHTLVFIFRLEAVVWKKRKPLATAAAAHACLTTPILSSPCYSLCFFSVFFGWTKEEQHDRKKNVYKLAKSAGCFILFFVTYFLFHWILLYVLSNFAFTFVQSKVVSEDYRLFFVKSTYYKLVHVLLYDIFVRYFGMISR